MNKIPYQRQNHAPALNRASNRQPPFINTPFKILTDTSTTDKSGSINAYPSLSSYFSGGSPSTSYPTTQSSNQLSSVLSSPVFAPINNMFTTVKYGVIGTVIIIILMISKKK